MSEAIGPDGGLSFTLLSRHEGGSAITSERDVEAFRRDTAAIARELGGDARPGEQVLVVCQDRYLFACALVAAWARGFVVALPPSTQVDRVRLLRERGDVRTVLHDQEDPGIDVRGLVGREGGEPLALPPIPASRELVVLYTSGSTGEPIGCMKTAGQLLGEASVLRDAFEFGPSDRIFATVPPHHIYGLLFGVLVPLVSGASFVREVPMHAEPLAAAYRASGATVLVSVPAHLRSLEVLDPSAFAPSPPRRTFSSGAALPAEVARTLGARFELRVTEILGSSETGGIGHRLAVHRADDEEAPFVALPQVTVSVAPDGRMQIDSPFLDRDVPRPFVAADRVERIDARTFRHLGRADGVVKVGGTRVSVKELEARLLAIAGVTDAAVWAVPVGGARGYETRAVVAGRGADGAPIDVATLRGELLRYFDPVAIPRRFRVLEALPREPTGKLRREVLERLFERG